MMWVRLLGLLLVFLALKDSVLFSVIWPPSWLGSFAGSCKMARLELAQTARKKAGFGEGTPQQVRPERESQFQILKLWPQVDTCLSLFLSVLKIQIQNGTAKPEVQVHRSVSCLRGSPFTPDEVPAPVLQRRCQARPHFCGVVALYPIQTAYAVIKVRIKNCRPVVLAASLPE